MNRILLLTSCNRIKQTIFALTVNSYVIRKPFHLIVSDGSTYNSNWEEQKNIHNYWHDEIFEKNYCSDIKLFEPYIKLLPNIISYKIIHSYPKMPKQVGESSLLNLGISQATTLINDSVCIKINGVVMLKFDLFEDVENVFTKEKKELYLFGRTNAMDQISTRVFGFVPTTLSQAIAKSSWAGWYEYEAKQKEFSGEISNWMEFKMKDTVNQYIDTNSIHHTHQDETSVLLDEGNKHNYKNIIF